MTETKEKYRDLQMEIAAINLLQQVGVSFNIPLREDETALLRRKNKFSYKLSHFWLKRSLPANLDVTKTEIPDYKNPSKMIEVYVADVHIYPLYLETIDAIRSKRLELELRDPLVKSKLESLEADEYLLKYTDELLEVIAIATINSADLRKHASEIAKWKRFYRKHLTNVRLLKLVGIIIAMQDTASFHNSIRLIMGVGTTAPSEASRIESQSAD